MSRRTRREFLGQSLAGAAFAGFAIGGTKSSGRIIGANDTIRLGVAGLNGRGGSHVDEFGKMDGVEISYLIDPDIKTYDKRIKQLDKLKPGSNPRTVTDVRRGARRQEPRRHLDRHAQPLARPDDHLGLPGRQGRLRREALQPQRPRGAGRGRGRAEVRPDRPARHPEPVESQASGPRLPRSSSRASMASCSFPEGSATSPGSRSQTGNIGFKPDGPAPENLDFNLWTGPALRACLQRQLRPLQLALVLGLRQRRHRQPGRPRDGHRPLDDPRRHACRSRSPVWAAGSATRTRGRRRTPRSPFSTTAIPSSSSRSAASRPTTTWARRSATSLHLEAGTIAGGKFTPEGSAPRPSPWSRSKGSPEDQARGTSATSSPPSGPGRTRTSTPTSSKAGYSAALCHLANISYRLGEPVSFASSTNPFGNCVRLATRPSTG